MNALKEALERGIQRGVAREHLGMLVEKVGMRGVLMELMVISDKRSEQPAHDMQDMSVNQDYARLAGAIDAAASLATDRDL